jgi:hypothetical protein
MIAALLLAAVSTVLWAAPEQSGFLDSYPPLQADASMAGVQRWESPSFDRAKYTRVIIEPITIFIAADSKYKGIDADDLKTLADGFRTALIDALEPDYPVVEKAGSGTLVARLAITNVKLKKKKRGLLGYTPVGMVVTAAKDAAGKRIELVDAGIEAELVDAMTGDQLAVVVDRPPLSGEQGEPESWAAIQARLQSYARRFRERMDAARK